MVDFINHFETFWDVQYIMQPVKQIYTVIAQIVHVALSRHVSRHNCINEFIYWSSTGSSSLI